MGLKSTSAEIESLKMNYEKSLLYKQICRQGNKIMKSLKKEKPFPDVKNMIASVNHVGQRNINNKGMEQEIIAYRGTRDIDVIVKDSVNNKYYFVSGTSFDKFNRGGNLLLHEKYIEIKPDIINTLPSSAILNNQNEKLENEQECCEDDYEYEL